MSGAPERAARAAALGDLPDDIGRRLDIYVDLLRRWQPTINLVAPSTLPDIWTRHIADSRQVLEAAPQARRWVDFGSGGGLPGIVVAIFLGGDEGARVDLVESDKRKAAFLRTAVRETGVAAGVHAQRIERFTEQHDELVEAVTARALAPLPQLVAYSAKFLLAGAVGVFPKGETADAELTGFDAAHKFRIESVPSRVRSGSSLLIVRTRADGSIGGD